jgi:hypothetical protein
MNRILGITVKAFAVATVILAIVLAYVFGVMEGVNSQQWRIKELLEELHPGFIINFFPWVHPLWHPLLIIAFIFGVCWIVIIVIALHRRKN